MDTSPILPLRGELAALAAALLWAIASVVYTRLGTQISPLLLNLSKGIVAIALLLVTVLLQGKPSLGLMGWPLGLLVVSGLVGIGLGDTFYFEALNRLGPHRTLLMQTLAPPLAALLAWGFLGEGLVFWDGLGMALTLAGVVGAIGSRPWSSRLASPALAFPLGGNWGLVYGFLAALTQAGAVVLSRAALKDTATDPLGSTLVRLVAGTAFLMVMVGGEWLPVQLSRQVSIRGWTANRRSLVQIGRSPRWWGAIVLTAFFSTYLGIWLQQISLKYADVGVAQALGATSPLFVLPLTLWLGERITWRDVGGVLLALGGIWCLLWP